MRAPTAFKTAEELVAEVRAGHATPSDIARSVLDDIQALDGTLNCFASLKPDDVMAQAAALDQRLAKGEDVGPLAGLPVSVKDLLVAKGHPTASGSLIMQGNVVDLDAPVVERLRAAGAVMLGKTTTSEFGCKAVGDSPLTGITRNPWNTEKTPGGSSCGAAALVAAGITPVAIGTDGGGSLRIPASLTGLVGFKGHFGRVPAYPAAAVPTLIHIGPLARRVRDAALMMSVISGYDERDPFSIAAPKPDFLAACERRPKGLRVAYSPTLGYARPDPHVTKMVEAALARLEAAGCEIDVVEQAFDNPVEIWKSEFYGGVGTRLKTAMETRRNDLDSAVASALDSAYSRSMTDYQGRLFERFQFRDKVRSLFENYDILATPSLPVTAFDVGRNTPPGHEDQDAISWAYYSYPFNLTGQPAVSLNAGFDADGLPVGLQLVARPLAEETLFSLAQAFEEQDPDPDRRPSL
ncbi:MAG: amidase [Rhodospirillales bacterium]|nr:amidase [Rhodospirillales bacterium]